MRGVDDMEMMSKRMMLEMAELQARLETLEAEAAEVELVRQQGRRLDPIEDVGELATQENVRPFSVRWRPVSGVGYEVWMYMPMTARDNCVKRNGMLVMKSTGGDNLGEPDVNGWVALGVFSGGSGYGNLSRRHGIYIRGAGGMYSNPMTWVNGLAPCEWWWEDGLSGYYGVAGIRQSPVTIFYWDGVCVWQMNEGEIHTYGVVGDADLEDGSFKGWMSVETVEADGSLGAYGWRDPTYRTGGACEYNLQELGRDASLLLRFQEGVNEVRLRYLKFMDMVAYMRMVIEEYLTSGGVTGGDDGGGYLAKPLVGCDPQDISKRYVWDPCEGDEGGFVLANYWTLSGSSDNCYGESIGNSSKHMVISLDSLKLKGTGWEVEGDLSVMGIMNCSTLGIGGYQFSSVALKTVVTGVNFVNQSVTTEQVFVLM